MNSGSAFCCFKINIILNKSDIKIPIMIGQIYAIFAMHYRSEIPLAYTTQLQLIARVRRSVKAKKLNITRLLAK